MLIEIPSWPLNNIVLLHKGAHGPFDFSYFVVLSRFIRLALQVLAFHSWSDSLHEVIPFLTLHHFNSVEIRNRGTSVDAHYTRVLSVFVSY